MTSQTKSVVTGLLIAGVVIGAYFLGTLTTATTKVDPLDLLSQSSLFADTPMAEWFSDSRSTESSTTPLSELIDRGDQLSVPDVVDAASESVVTVSIKKQQQILDPSAGGIFGFGPFGLGIPGGQTRIEEVQRDIGTGFVVDASGLVVTNRHVVADPQAEYLVIDSEDNEYKVTQIYRDPINDMAIVKAEGLSEPALPLGDSDTIRVGEAVIAIGTALGEFRHTVTTGVISGLWRGIVAGDGLSQAEELENVIQTDAAINPGNSGGPLINALGKVIGVNVAVSQTAQNIGFAIPINVIKASLDNFNQTGQFARPYLGVSYQMITERAALANEVPQGAYIAEVVPGSPAERIGLQAGDILVAIDDKQLKDEELAAVLNTMRVGQTVRLQVWRDGETITLNAQLESNE